MTQKIFRGLERVKKGGRGEKGVAWARRHMLLRSSLTEVFNHRHGGKVISLEPSAAQVKIEVPKQPLNNLAHLINPSWKLCGRLSFVILSDSLGKNFLFPVFLSLRMPIETLKGR